MAGGRLTTHVLDTANGCPAAGISVRLFALDGDARTLLKTEITNHDGRCDAPLLTSDSMRIGHYELIFEVAAYFRAKGTMLTDPPFLDQVPIRFAIAQPDAHYHVPLLISPYAFSTYRGS